MARFKNQVSKGIEEEPKTKNHFLENEDQKPETISQEPETRNHKPETMEPELEGTSGYSESDLEPVNVAGFKVPYVVREHWKAECRKKKVKLSPILKSFLVGEFGLPPGFRLEDL